MNKNEKILTIVLVIVGFTIGFTEIQAQEDIVIPSWVKGVAEYWVEDKIDDGEFAEAIKFFNSAILAEDLVLPGREQTCQGAANRFLSAPAQSHQNQCPRVRLPALFGSPFLGRCQRIVAARVHRVLHLAISRLAHRTAEPPPKRHRGLHRHQDRPAQR